jgi:sec-independent protein translocase protein TatA
MESEDPMLGITPPGGPEWLIILLIFVLLFGARKLPELGSSVGKSIRNFKRGISTDDEINVTPVDKQVESDSSAQGLKDSVQRQASESKS